jgi:hypothetical protein
MSKGVFIPNLTLNLCLSQESHRDPATRLPSLVTSAAVDSAFDNTDQTLGQTQLIIGPLTKSGNKPPCESRAVYSHFCSHCLDLILILTDSEGGFELCASTS